MINTLPNIHGPSSPTLPQLADFGSGTARAQVGGRLTLTTGVPVTTSDVTGATTIYWAPYSGNQVSLYDGANWNARSFSELSLAIGTKTAFVPRDVFVYDNSGTPALEDAAWLNATVTMTIDNPCVVTWTTHGMNNGDPVVFTTSGALPSGLSANTQYWVVNKAASTFQVAATYNGAAIVTTGTQSGAHTGWQARQRSAALARQDGTLVKGGDATRLYLGTYCTTSTTTTEDSGGGTTTQVGGKRYLWNNYHRRRRGLCVIDTTDNWATSSATWAEANAAAGNKLEYVCGADEDYVEAVLHVSTAPTTLTPQVTIGFDATDAAFRDIAFGYLSSGSNVYMNLVSTLIRSMGLGYHFLPWLERNSGAGSSTFYGSGFTSQSSLMASIFG